MLGVGNGEGGVNLWAPTARAYNPFAKRLAVELDNRPGERMAVKPVNLDMVDSE